MSFTRTYLVIVLLFLSLVLKAQAPNHFYIGEDILSNLEVYSIIKSQNQTLYVTTNHGVFIYKNGTFEQLESTKEQLGASLFQLRNDQKGNTYCSNLGGQIFKIEDQKLTLFYEANSDEIKTNFFYFFNEENNLVYAGTKLIEVQKDGSKQILHHFPNNKETIQEYSHGHMAYDSSFFLSSFYTDTQTVYDNMHVSFLNPSFGNKNEHQTHLILNKQSYFITSLGHLLSADNGNSIYSSSSTQPEYFIQISNKEVLARGRKKGIRILNFENDSLKETKSFFNHTFISSVFLDQDGILYLGTFGNGLIVIPNYQSINLRTNKELSGIACSSKNEVFLSSRDGHIYQLNDSLISIDEHPYNLEKIFYNSSTIPYPFTSRSDLIYTSYSDESNGIGSIKDVASSHKHLFIASNLGICSYTNTTGVQKIKMGKRFNAISTLDTGNLIYYANQNAVFSNHLKSHLIDTLSFEGNTFIANDLTTFENKLICATYQHGLLFFENHQFIKQISSQDGLFTNNVLKTVLHENKLFLLTTKGLQVINLTTEEIIDLGLKEGITSSSIKDFALSSDHVWILDRYGIYNIPFERIRPITDVPPFQIEEILINNNKTNLTNFEDLDYQQNTFSFQLDYADIISMPEANYLYKVDNLHADWQKQPVTDPIITFGALPPGNYNFQIKVKYRNNESNTVQFPIHIALPFWQTFWFYLFLVMATGLIVFILFKRRMNRMRKEQAALLEKQKLQTSILESELKALRSQMNPHFIFNSLNSIQDLILKEDIDNSYDYIVLFAKLVRNTLNYSNKDFIPIEQELEFLEVYLSLEKLRFEDDFEYQITYEGTKDIKVPSLLIQPFIENALVHGLIHKKGLKKLDIHFELNDLLTCTITDNGVGRARAKEIQMRQRGEHESFAMKAIQQRLEILNQQEKNFQGSYEIIDLNDNEVPIGTKIIINIPYKNLY